MDKPDPINWIHAVLSDFEQPLMAYARSLLGGLEPARDAVQETFIELCQAQREEVESRVKPWLYAVCRNRCLDMIRKENRMKPLEPETMESFPGAEAPPSAELEQKEAKSALLRVIKTLPDNQQEVIRLKFLHGMSYRQISGVTQLSESNVGFLIHTGIKTLRQKLIGPMAEHNSGAFL